MPKPLPPILDIQHTKHFEVTGLGDDPAWEQAQPIPINPRDRLGHPELYTTWLKMLWTHTGVYFLFDCADPKLCCSGLRDMQDLWREDVAEVFLWPDPSVPIYFEYCISPLGADIPILIPDIDGEYVPWTPWNYNDGRRVHKGTSVRGGKAEPGAPITGWKAEFFIPSKLMRPLRNVRPDRGMTWKANFYRLDYDHGRHVRFAYHDVGLHFHNHAEFPTIRFV